MVGESTRWRMKNSKDEDISLNHNMVTFNEKLKLKLWFVTKEFNITDCVIYDVLNYRIRILDLMDLKTFFFVF